MEAAKFVLDLVWDFFGLVGIGIVLGFYALCIAYGVERGKSKARKDALMKIVVSELKEMEKKEGE